ncbi:transposase [Nonomuraea sp. NPDC048881]|uniref:transposase n=1 Tax=Nonomuraea sp. NPDC048881 TaxID=3155030 RepID=UPI0033D33C35
MRRHDLTDAQWAALEPHLPATSGTDKGRPPKWSRRQLIDGIRTRALCRDVPVCYGRWCTVYGLFRRGQPPSVRSQPHWTTHNNPVISHAPR